MNDFGVEVAEQERLAVVAAMCQPCSGAHHGDCTGCPCRETYHDLMAPWQLGKSGWTADEINDHEHDLGIGPWETKYDDLEWERRDQEERTSVPYVIGGE